MAAVVLTAAVFTASMIGRSTAGSSILSVRSWMVVALAHFWTTVVLRSRCVVRLSTTIAAIILVRHRTIHVTRVRVRNVAVHAAIAWPILRFRTRRSHVMSMELVRTRCGPD